jgi:hypothetical protein
MNKQELLQDQIDKAIDSINSIFNTIDQELSHPAKNFTVFYDGKHVDLCHPTTLDDKKEMDCRRRDFVEFILLDALKVTLSKKVQDMDLYTDEGWENIHGVMGGEDPADHQYEKYKETGVVESSGPDNVVRSVPLNMENYQVKENLGLLDEDKRVEQNRKED